MYIGEQVYIRLKIRYFCGCVGSIPLSPQNYFTTEETIMLAVFFAATDTYIVTVKNPHATRVLFLPQRPILIEEGNKP